MGWVAVLQKSRRTHCYQRRDDEVLRKYSRVNVSEHGLRLSYLADDHVRSVTKLMIRGIFCVALVGEYGPLLCMAAYFFLISLSVLYCEKNCQRLNWPAHRPICQEMQRALRGESVSTR